MRIEICFSLIAFFGAYLIVSCNGVDGAQSVPIKVLKTADGDIFDCVDIYKQPAFDHPRLKDHKILMRPSLPLQGLQELNTREGIEAEIKLEGEGCPEGTVPIFRSPTNTSGTSPSSLPIDLQDDPDYSKAWAVSTAHPSQYHGVAAGLNVYAVWPVWAHQQSSSVIWAINRGATPDQTSVVAAGWTGNPAVFGDDKTRIFIEWSANGEKTVCVNLQCPGFVLVSRSSPIGKTLWPVSTYKGHQAVMPYHIYKDGQNNWWLAVYNIDNVIGYWPAALFTNFDYASEVKVGGFVSCLKSDKRCPKMGNGHSPKEDPYSACFAEKIIVMRESGRWEDLPYIEQDSSSNVPQCYDAGPYHYETGSNFVFPFGGPPCNHW